MPYLDLEIGLNDEQIAIRETVHKFADEVLRPAGIALDRLADPAEVIAEGSPLWGVFEKHRELGLHREDLLEAEPDPLRRAVTNLLIQEELGWGDGGLAISLGVAGFHRLFARLSGKPALVERFAGPDNRDIGCWAITEPDHGSDTLAFSMKHFSDPSLRPNCTAVRDGKDWIIRGQKAAWVSNGTIATVAALFVTVNPEHGFAGGGVCLVPLDLPGVSRGKPIDKLGQRPLNQSEIFFDDVRLPEEYMLLGEPMYQPVVEQVLTLANASMGAIFVGLARAGYEQALHYAKERVQGGVPIFEHQSVKARLFRMFMAVEAARALARRVALYNTTQPPHVQHSIASKVFCTNTAFEVASEALQIHGGNGLSREYPIEKMLRDARAAMIEDGCNDLLGLVAAEKL
jgi:alkylation response protein AidB-like acyl-CoA dehydrogenase